ncbi:MAG: pyrroline-5-carboxylate reductase [Phycisphaerales bacterium]|nr:pyrroline-5-carboxylate reductase [Phycisphaerales bacterium]
MSSVFELGVIGGGNMAWGIISAAVGRRLFPGSAVLLAEPQPDRRQLFSERLGVVAIDDNRRVLAECRRIMLAIKPQQFDDVAAGLRDQLTDNHMLCSIIAGMSTQQIAAAFPGVAVRVVRVMPNTPIQLGAGIAGICAGEHATAEDLACVRRIFEAGGAAVVLDDEELMDAVTAVSGSGPAYFYYFVEAIVAGGVACGLSEEDALKLATHTCLGAARMMLETGESPAKLRHQVTSKGGTTQAALECMEQSNIPTCIMEAVQAAFRRGRELGS